MSLAPCSRWASADVAGMLSPWIEDLRLAHMASCIHPVLLPLLLQGSQSIPPAGLQAQLAAALRVPAAARQAPPAAAVPAAGAAAAAAG
jgi:hypothetical protein